MASRAENIEIKLPSANMYGAFFFSAESSHFHNSSSELNFGGIREPVKKDMPIELMPDAWARFERAVHVVAKSPPQHRVKKPTAKLKNSPKKKAPSKRR